MKTFGVFIIITMLWGFSGFQEPDKKEVKAKKQLEMAQLIEGGHFRFVARSAHSDLGTFNNLSPSYDLIIDSLRVKAFLPYFGRAYKAPYGNDKGGVKFDLTAEKIDRSYNERKKMFLISTSLKDLDDSYSIQLTVGLNGYADLKIDFMNRQWISYYGTIEKLEQAK